MTLVIPAYIHAPRLFLSPLSSPPKKKPASNRGTARLPPQVVLAINEIEPALGFELACS